MLWSTIAVPASERFLSPRPRASVNQRDLALDYSPGVAYACLAIKDDPNEAASLTLRASAGAVEVALFHAGKACGFVAETQRSPGPRNNPFRNVARAPDPAS